MSNYKILPLVGISTTLMKHCYVANEDGQTHNRDDIVIEQMVISSRFQSFPVFVGDVHEQSSKWQFFRIQKDPHDII